MLTLLLSFSLSVLIAQTNDHYIITTQGNHSKGETLSLSWTIGDVMTGVSVLNETTVTQGFQQPVITVKEIGPLDPKEIAADHVTSPGPIIGRRSVDDFAAQVHPNPFGAGITVQVKNDEQDYILDIFDTAGNLLSRSKSNSPQQTLNLADLPAAQYTLRVSLVESDQMKVFQITKSR